MNKLKLLIKKPYAIILHWNAKGYFKFLPDKIALKLIWYGTFGKNLNFHNPVTFNEKLQWLKLYNRNDIYTQMVDKYQVKKYLSSIVGEEYIIPTLGVWQKFDEIDFNILPDKFVLKTTHDSGGVVICTNKEEFDFLTARDKLNERLESSWYIRNREWPYKDVEPRIIAEPYLEDDFSHDLKDYKFFCFNGIPKIMFVATERQNSHEETRFDYYDMSFKHLDLINIHPNANVAPSKPNNFELMKELAAKVSEGIPHVRVDFFEANGCVYIGEMTFFHQSGLSTFEPVEWNIKLGNWIDLSNV